MVSTTEIVAPNCDIFINEKNLEIKGGQISSVEVDLTCGYEASGCVFEIINGYNAASGEFDGGWYDQVLQIGKPVEVKLGGISMETVFTGYIDSITSRFDSEEGISVTVSCIDAKGAMMAGRYKTVAMDKKYGDIINPILCNYCSGFGATSYKIDDTTEVFKHQLYNYQTDYELLVSIARKLNYEFFIQDKTIYFRKRSSASSECTLKWGVDVISLSREISLKDQLGSVTVIGNDVINKKVISYTASSVAKMRSKSAADAFSKVSQRKETIYDPTVKTDSSARQLAESILNERAMSFVSCHGECSGNPKLKPGKYLTLEKFDSSINGVYYIKKVKHVFDENGYYTKFELEANSI